MEKHIVFADRENIPDMRVIPRTQKSFQAIENCSGEKTLTMADLQCLCAPCRTNPGNLETCMYRDERGEIKTHAVRPVETNKNDPHQLKSMTIQQLKDELKARNLPVTGAKSVLIRRLTTYLDADHTAVNYDLIESEEQATNRDNLN